MRAALWLVVASWALPVHAQPLVARPLSSFTPLARTIAALTSADAGVRREAAEHLAVIGPRASVIDPLRVAMEHEPVPETRSAMIGAIARRADEEDVTVLESAWEHATPSDRRLLVRALDAIGGESAMQRLRAHLTGEPGPAACAALVRTEARVRWLAGTLDDPTSRDHVVACLASAAPSEPRDAALVQAGLDLEPASARQVLAALAESPTAPSAAIAMATNALTRSDVTLAAPALALLARHAPDQVPLDRWRALVDEHDERAASALRALLLLDASAADAALARARSDSETARRALSVLLDRADAGDLARIAAFVDVPETRAAALDALSMREGGAAALAALPPASDVDLALALSRPADAALTALLTRGPSILLRALARNADAAQCAVPGEADASERRRAAACLAFVSDGDAPAARALETERDRSVVPWLALAARDQPITPSALEPLFDAPTTRLAAFSLAIATLAHAEPRERRAIETRLVRATRDLDASVRAMAVRAIAALGQARHRAVVLRALEDPAAPVRLAAVLALAHVGVELTDIRVVGRSHVEPDARVLAVLLAGEGGVPLAVAAAPLHVRVIEHDAAIGGTSSVSVFLADGRALALFPVDGELLVPRVPDAPAIVELHTASEH